MNARLPDAEHSGGGAKAGADATTLNCYPTTDQPGAFAGGEGAMVQAGFAKALEANGTADTSGTQLLGLDTETTTRVDPTNTPALVQLE
ncbi:hypothetical protein HK405_001178, partial [Cladochytrium tenue]